METAAALAAALDAALTAAGYRHRLAPIGIVEKLDRDIRGLLEQGLLAADLFAEYSASFTFVLPPEVLEPRTLIVVAWPSRPVKARFHLEDGPLEAVIPPTYVSSAARARCLEALRSVLGAAGYSVERAPVPNKLLAARTGLARYGRNNLAYVHGMGTFTRLDAFCTDADLAAVVPQFKGSLRMSSCPPCRSCHQHCPTGCIPYDGTVIDATRCLTQLNENEGEWPDWLEPRAHNALVGCMRCQDLCPADRYYLRKESVVAEFDRAETEAVLQNLPPARLPETVLAKLRELDLEQYSTVLGRNLLALHGAVARASAS
jgi:epoxyqueuosine reductase